jgi:hypothetical protein
MYDTRSLARIAQVEHSLNEIKLPTAGGGVQTVHRSQVSSWCIYKHEMALLLRRRLRALGNLQRFRPPPADA